jgi:catechol 2,3-dioxygenase-like lactoylglutathione lyase family enzyme
MEAKKLHRGRLIDHVHLIARDLAASRRFYDAALGAVGRKVEGEGEGYFWSDELFVSGAAMATTGASHVHLAFQAADRAAVDRFHAAALAAGGKDHGAPGPRPNYGPNYYAAFVKDREDNNIEVVCYAKAKAKAKAKRARPRAR